MTKFALLIGVSEYLAGGLNHLRSLPSALIDVDVLSAVLGDPQRGGFPAENITVLKNPDVQQMRDAIYRLFHNRQKNDLILLYFSGHGIKDEQNDLYLATKITRKNDDNSLDQPSAVAAIEVHNWMQSSKSQHQVIILDSCFSGAFAKGMTLKDDGIVRVKDYFGGKGTAILTSSTSTEYSLSPEPIEHQNTQPSIYTRYLVEGLTTGAADLDKDGDISADELHEYVAKKVKEVAPSMTPKFFPAQEGYKLLLSKAPRNDRKLEYEQKVQEYADKDRGNLSRLQKKLLIIKQREWGISPSDAQIIEDRVLQPYLEYEEKLSAYQEVLTELVQSHYPLSAKEQADLKEYQQELKLRDKDIAEIHRRLLPQASSTQPNPAPAAIPTAPSAPVTQSPVIEPTQTTIPLSTFSTELLRPHPLTTSFSKLITPDEMPAIRCNQVIITANLYYSAVTEESYKQLQRLAENWLPVSRDRLIEPPIEVSQAFKRKNKARSKDFNSHGIREEKAVMPLVRLVANPLVRGSRLILTVAPISWDLYSVTVPYPNPDAPLDNYIGSYKPTEDLLQSIKNYKEKFPPTLDRVDDRVEERFISPRNFVPLGLEALVITNDGYALLRYRDKTSTVGGGEWDVSFSGYARFDTEWCVNRIEHGDLRVFELNLSRWAQKEFERETGVEEHFLNVEEGLVVGVHRNIKSGAVDILAYFRVDCTAKEIAKKIHINHQLDIEINIARENGLLSDEYEKVILNKLESKFEETYSLEKSKGAKEVEVHGTSNLFIRFTPEKINEFFTKAFEKNEKILPEAKQVIDKALEEEY
jgi:hypothetical protein